MAEQIRTFIAIELNDQTWRALSDLQVRLKRAPSANAIRWVVAENIHLTLKFLGDVDVEKIPALERALRDACAGIAPFDLKFGGVGAFPNANRANVIWVGVQGDIEIARQLAQRIDDVCAELGFPREVRAFSPHLTLGRVKLEAGTRERAEIARMIASAPPREVGSYRVERVSIMKSELRPGGSVYSVLAVIRL